MTRRKRGSASADSSLQLDSGINSSTLTPVNKNNATASDNRRNVKTRTDREKTRVKAEPTDNAIQNRCLLCSLPAGSVQCFDRHVSCSSGLNRRAMYECRECKYRVSVRRSMMLHLRSHTERKQYSCPRCTYTAPHQRAVNEHRRNVHKEILPLNASSPNRDTTANCPHCRLPLGSMECFNSHIRRWTKDGRVGYECLICKHSREMNYTSPMVIHLRTHTGERPYSCPHCPYRAAQQGTLQKHVAINHSHINPPATDTATGDSGSTAAKCPLCQLPLGSVECFHLHTKRDGTGYKCRFCDCRTRDKTGMSAHIRVHTGEKPFSCPHCPYRSASPSSVKEHIRKLHEANLGRAKRAPVSIGPGYGVLSEVCPLCRQALGSELCFRRHIKRRKESGSMVYRCRICQFKVSTRHHIQTHLRIHTEERPYSCPHCSHKSTQLRNMERHIDIMHKDRHQDGTRKGRPDSKLSTCASCGKRLESAECFNSHAGIVCVAGRMRYQCKICGCKTKGKSPMVLHLRIHTGSKPFCCPHCPYRTSNDSVLKIHIRSSHKGRKTVPRRTRNAPVRISVNRPAKATLVSNHEDRKSLQEIHSSSRTSQCLMCGYVSKSRMCLYSHMKVDERSGVRHYSCCICRLPTLSKYFILKHVASHVKSGNSRCLETGEDKCGDVKSWTRSAVKPSYRRCPRCCCIAGSQACIRQHVFTSADDDATVYSCRLCEFTWTRLSAIRRHVTSHIQDVSDCDSSRAGGTGEDNSTDTLDSAVGMTESHDDDTDTDRNDRIMEYFIHPVTSIFIYMKSASGGAPFLCPHCDYKTTMECLFQGHMSRHNT